MGIVATLLVGLVIGIVAKLLTPGRDPGGCLLTALLGVAGSALGSRISASGSAFTAWANRRDSSARCSARW